MTATYGRHWMWVMFRACVTLWLLCLLSLTVVSYLTVPTERKIKWQTFVKSLLLLLVNSRSQGPTDKDACSSLYACYSITPSEYCLHFLCRGNNLQLFRGSHAKNEQQLPARRSYGHALCKHAITNSSTSRSFLLWLQ